MHLLKVCIELDLWHRILPTDSTRQVSTDSLNLLQTMHIDSREYMIPGQCLISILSSIPRALREVTVYLQVGNRNEPKLPGDEEIATFTELDSVLCHSSLKEVKMTVCLYNSSPLVGAWASVGARDRWQQWSVKMLPKFCASGDRLTVTWNPTLRLAYLRYCRPLFSRG